MKNVVDPYAALSATWREDAERWFERSRSNHYDESQRKHFAACAHDRKACADQLDALRAAARPSEGAQQCAFEGCEASATTLACGRDNYGDGATRHPKPAHYCDTHAGMVADESSPEYIESCPNCGCRFGVN